MCLTRIDRTSNVSFAPTFIEVCITTRVHATFSRLTVTLNVHDDWTRKPLMSLACPVKISKFAADKPDKQAFIFSISLPGWVPIVLKNRRFKVYASRPCQSPSFNKCFLFTDTVCLARWPASILIKRRSTCYSSQLLRLVESAQT